MIKALGIAFSTAVHCLRGHVTRAEWESVQKRAPDEAQMTTEGQQKFSISHQREAQRV